MIAVICAVLSLCSFWYGHVYAANLPGIVAAPLIAGADVCAVLFICVGLLETHTNRLGKRIDSLAALVAEQSAALFEFRFTKNVKQKCPHCKRTSSLSREEQLALFGKAVHCCYCRQSMVVGKTTTPDADEANAEEFADAMNGNSTNVPAAIFKQTKL